MFLKSSGLYLGRDGKGGWARTRLLVGRHSRDPLCIVCFPTYVSKKHVQDTDLYITSYSYIQIVIMTIIYMTIYNYIFRTVYGYTVFKLSSIITKRYTYMGVS